VRQKAKEKVEQEKKKKEVKLTTPEGLLTHYYVVCQSSLVMKDVPHVYIVPYG
jgi:hypothetical protein